MPPVVSAAMARSGNSSPRPSDDGAWEDLPEEERWQASVPDGLRRRTGLPADSYGAITFDKADLVTTPALAFIGRCVEEFIDTVLVSH